MKKDRWLNRVPRKTKKKPPPPPPDPEGYGTFWYPVQCTNCGGENTKIYSTKGTKRYYVCHDCGHRFKAIKADPPE